MAAYFFGDACTGRVWACRRFVHCGYQSLNCFRALNDFSDLNFKLRRAGGRADNRQFSEGSAAACVQRSVCDADWLCAT
jgi:hypothetical protein